MSDQRNMIIAIALSVLVLVGFQYFSEQLIPGRQATTENLREEKGRRCIPHQVRP